MKNKKICIIGGGGHVGLPLGLVLASKGNEIYLYEKNKKICSLLNEGIMPYYEVGAKKLLKKYKKKIKVGFNSNFISQSDVIIVSVGTPVDKKLNPKFKDFFKLIYFLKKKINKNQILIIRSSVYPGIIEKIKNILGNVSNNISYCPERILQGKAINELPKLPQIVSGYNKLSIEVSKNLFKSITRKIIITSILEAELIKLFSNAWRYINFAASNQFFMICQNFGIDFKKIRNFMMEGYSRNANLPKAGFAAGPCLLKDTMQLSHFVNKKFPLGIESLNINEGLPRFIVNNMKKKYKLKNKKIGILGLAFKSNVDDVRDSLSIKLLKILKKISYKVFVSDEFYDHPEGISKENLIKKSDIVIVAVPHTNYKKIKIPKNKVIIDTWGIVKKDNFKTL
jgi:UDP-N-acetyl-D-mannosaminuronic acid dehydrogenase